jgi:hypothetical protein
VFCLNAYGPYEIQKFDKSTYRLLDTLPIPEATIASGEPVNLIRWGNAGLAFNTVPSILTTSNPGSIFLVDGSFVNNALPPDTTNGTGVEVTPVLVSLSPQDAPAGSADVTTTITGRNFLPGAVAYWNGFKVVGNNWNVLDTVYISPTQLEVTIPAADLTTAGYGSVFVANGAESNVTPQDFAGFTITPTSTGMIGLSLASLDVAWDKNTGLLYAAVWDLDPQYPDSIVAIDPSTGGVVKSQIVGSDPYLVRISDDGQYLYTGYLNSTSATQLQMPGLNSPLTWSLRLSGEDEPWIALDMQPAPGASQTTAVSLGLYTASPIGEGGITIFDNNIARPTRANGYGGSFGGDYISLQWGSDASTLYGADGTDLHTLVVSPAGVSPVKNDYTLGVYSPLTSNTYIHYDASTGYIYDDGAQVINPANGNVIGTFNPSGLGLPNSVSGLVVPDSTLNRILILGQTASQLGTENFTIQSYNEHTLAPIGSLTVQNIVGVPESFIRWGNSGLALTTFIRNSGDFPSGMLYILNDTSFVSSNQSTLLPGAQLEPLMLTWKVHPLPRHASSEVNRADM